MEVSQMLQRQLIHSLSRSLRCQCSLADGSRSIHHQARRSPSSKRLPQFSRAFSTSSRTRQEEATSSQSVTATEPPPAASPKQALKSYISTVNTIIDNFNLKDELAPRQYELLVNALTQAEVRADAPGQTSDFFAPQLASLKGEVDPILKQKLGTSDTQILRERATNRTNDLLAPTLTTATPQTSPSAPTPPKSSAAAGLDALFHPQSQRTPGSPFSKETGRLSDFFRPRSSSSNTSPSSFLSNIIPPRQGQGSQSTLSSTLDALSRKRALDIDTRLNSSDTLFLSEHGTGESLRLNPSLGRTVRVEYGSDVTRTFRQLEGLCFRNNVRNDLFDQRFHVRRGQRRKTLRIKRWRKMFMGGFLEECGRVRKMRKQGW